VPVSRQRHGEWSVKAGTDYLFAKQVNSMPLMAVEFENAAPEYPIVFTGIEEEIFPSIILGISEENIYLTETGNWETKYIPAFARRYPFVFSKSDDADRFTLCIDEEFDGFNQEGRGERLFDSEGEQTQYLKNVLGFLQEYQRHFQITRSFCQKIKALDLLEPMQAMFRLPTGEPRSLTGFLAVSKEQLKKLTGDQLEELMRTGQLDLLYWHLQSMQNFSSMLQRVKPQGEEDIIQNSPENAAVGDET
jgi:SapC